MKEKVELIQNIDIFKGEYLKIINLHDDETITYVQCTDVRCGGGVDWCVQSILFVGQIIEKSVLGCRDYCKTVYNISPNSTYWLSDTYMLNIPKTTEYKEYDIQFISQEEFDKVKQQVIDILS